MSAAVITILSAVQIFPKMKNYTPYNRATSVGNQLLNNYRKFLLNYEICHRSRDLGGPIATPSAVTEVGCLVSSPSSVLPCRCSCQLVVLPCVLRGRHKRYLRPRPFTKIAAGRFKLLLQLSSRRYTSWFMLTFQPCRPCQQQFKICLSCLDKEAIRFSEQSVFSCPS